MTGELGKPAIIIVSPPIIGEDGLPHAEEQVHNIYVPVKTPLAILLVLAIVPALVSLAGTYILSQRVVEYRLQVNHDLQQWVKANHELGMMEGEKVGVQNERNYQTEQNRKDAGVDLKGPPGKPGPRGKTGRAGSGVHIF